MFADIFGISVVTLASQEGSAYGAALLALVGTGQYASAKEACAAAIEENAVKQPGPDAVDYYNRAYPVYRSLYPALRQAYQQIGALDG
jgi:xylulokinase